MTETGQIFVFHLAPCSLQAPVEGARACNPVQLWGCLLKRVNTLVVGSTGTPKYAGLINFKARLNDVFLSLSQFLAYCFMRLWIDLCFVMVRKKDRENDRDRERMGESGHMHVF